MLVTSTKPSHKVILAKPEITTVINAEATSSREKCHWSVIIEFFEIRSNTIFESDAFSEFLCAIVLQL